LAYSTLSQRIVEGFSYLLFYYGLGNNFLRGAHYPLRITLSQEGDVKMRVLSIGTIYSLIYTLATFCKGLATIFKDAEFLSFFSELGAAPAWRFQVFKGKKKILYWASFNCRRLRRPYLFILLYLDCIQRGLLYIAILFQICKFYVWRTYLNKVDLKLLSILLCYLSCILLNPCIVVL